MNHYILHQNSKPIPWTEDSEYHLESSFNFSPLKAGKGRKQTLFFEMTCDLQGHVFFPNEDSNDLVQIPEEYKENYAWALKQAPVFGVQGEVHDRNFKEDPVALLKAGAEARLIYRSRFQHQDLRSCLFLDRDGVLNKDTNYVKDASKLEILELPKEVITFANNKAAYCGVLSNQSGIGRGIIREPELLEVNRAVLDAQKVRGQVLDFFFCCRTHPEKASESYKRFSFLRKPFPGMALLAAQLFPIDFSKSLMVGDKDTDDLRYLNMEFFKV